MCNRYCMKKNEIIIILTSILILLTFVFAKDSHASEGTIELTSQTDEPYKCYASSLRMQNLEYRIPFSCRNLIYPVDETIFNYVMWANTKDGGKTIKLGALGLGKGEFKTKTPFVTLFVTTERKKDTKTPTGRVVMRGNVQPIEFLESEITPTPTPPPDSEESANEEIQEEEIKQEITTREKLILALKRAGIAALFALVALIGIIFVVSKSRG